MLAASSKIAVFDLEASEAEAAPHVYDLVAVVEHKVHMEVRDDLALEQLLLDDRILAHVTRGPHDELVGKCLAQVLQQDDEQYRAYWTVRRHVGKGAPPRELATSAEVIAFVTANPGAVGYIDASELRAGLNVLLRP